MFRDRLVAGRNLFTSVFSDEPAPDVEAAIIVAHPGDEALSASWVMVRLQDRTSVYCVTKPADGRDDATVAAAALAGIHPERCHNLGLPEHELARDLETLVWLTTAAVSARRPRVLVTHACEGVNLDHDATAFAVHMTATLMTRSGAGAPVVVEVPTQWPSTDILREPLMAAAKEAVTIEFGPESRKVKRRMLRCHRALQPLVDAVALGSEEYIMATACNPLDNLPTAAGPYPDAAWCQVEDFRRQARRVAASFNLAVLSTPSRAS